MHDLPVTSSDALPLSYRRMVGAEPGAVGGGGGGGLGAERTKLDYFKNIVTHVDRIPRKFTPCLRLRV